MSVEAEERIAEKMVELGHGPPLLHDGPHRSRVTCGVCLRAGLNAGGPDYGSALNEECPGAAR